MSNYIKKTSDCERGSIYLKRRAIVRKNNHGELMTRDDQFNEKISNSKNHWRNDLIL